MADNFDERLRQVLRRYVTDSGEWQAVQEGAPLLGTTSLDSLSVVNMVTELELLFDVRFESDTLEQTLRNVHSLATFLEGCRAKPS